MSGGHDPDQPIGYKNPPRNRQFKPGQSGNPSGRPRKERPREEGIDMLAVLDEPVRVRCGGVEVEMGPREIALRQVAKKALAGDRRALMHVIGRFEKHKVYKAAQLSHTPSGVLALPSTMPWAMARLMAAEYGAPPWSAEALAAGRAAYIAQRSEEDACIDTEVGYADL